jgi:CheY-like chemotaxis protein
MTMPIIGARRPTFTPMLGLSSQLGEGAETPQTGGGVSPEDARQAKEAPHIILAEDDEDDYAFFREILLETHPEIRLTRFKNGEEVVHHLLKGGSKTPSIVVLDLNMPIMDGRQALREIKAEERFRSLPVFVLTTSAAPTDEAFVRGYPTTSFLTKPMKYLDYVALVRMLGNKLKSGQQIVDPNQ